MTTILVKKLSAKSIIGGVGELVKSGEIKDANTPVARMMGIATGTRNGTSQYGEWTALKGQFKAINLMTGEEYRASEAHPPKAVLDIVVGAIEQLKAQGEENIAVEFAIDVTVTPRPDLEIGYEYNAIPHIKEAADPFARLSEACPPLQLADNSAKGKAKAK